MADRYLLLGTPLGLSPPDLLLQRVAGEEALSRPFRFVLGFWATKTDIAGKDLISQPVTVTVTTSEGNQRYLNGIVGKLEAGALDGRGRRFYQAEMVPKLQLLAEVSNCRIFQNMATPDIVEQILNEQGVAFSANLTGTYNPREYCVQYRESDLDFIARLLEDEGIFYYFQHSASAHTLVLADANSAFEDCPDNQLAYSSAASMTTAAIQSWDHAFAVLPGKWSLTDYNFETPSISLLASTSTTSTWAAPSSERFDFPGFYKKKADGTTVSKLRMQEDETLSETARARTRVPSLFPGGTFTVSGHELAAEVGNQWVIVSVRHAAGDDSGIDAGAGRDYENEILCIPQATAFRPRRVTRKPYIHGLQTAVVTGSSGEEIFPDKYGRIKVKFFWDRASNTDDTSSCWIRVATGIAGKAWGMIHLPRVGQEVVVSFLEGDPDRPLIIGSVYNAEQMPPYTLPDNKTQSGYISRSSTGGTMDTYNALRFEDKKGSEEVYFHAQKDFNRVVENNDTLKVGSNDSNTCPDGDQTISIYRNRAATIETGDDSLTVRKGNQSVTISQGNRTVTVSQGDDSLTVSQGKRTVTVSGDTALEVQQGNRTVTVDTGNDTHKVSTGNRQVTVSTGNDTLEVSTGNHSIKVDLGTSSIEAMQSITLKVGQNSVTIDQTGVTIKGLQVKIQGQLQTQIQGLQTQISGSAMTQISGGITMIG